jgi:hypothetical protein
VAIILCSTSLGVLVPVLKDSGAARHHFRAADHRRGLDRRLRRDHPALDLLLGGGRDGSTLLLLGALFALAAAVFLAVSGAERSSASARTSLRLQDTTAQIRVRAALVLLVGFAPWPSRSGSR